MDLSNIMYMIQGYNKLSYLIISLTVVSAFEVGFLTTVYIAAGRDTEGRTWEPRPWVDAPMGT